MRCVREKMHDDAMDTVEPMAVEDNGDVSTDEASTVDVAGQLPYINQYLVMVNLRYAIPTGRWPTMPHTATSAAVSIAMSQPGLIRSIFDLDFDLELYPLFVAHS